MKETIYRGRRIDNGEWVKGLPFSRVGGGLYSNKINSIRCDSSGNIYTVYSETVDEYIGKTDKNGNMIFEHDIVKYTNNQRGTYEIGKKMRGFIVYNENLLTFISKNNFQKDTNWMFADDIKIIGNIHDNSADLLNGDNKNE